MNNEIKFLLGIDGAQAVRQGFDQVSGGADKTRESIRRLGGDTSSLGNDLDALGVNAGRIGVLLGTIGSVAAVGAFVRMGDAVTVLNNQLKLATGSVTQAQAAYSALFDIAQRSRTSFTDLGATFASLSRATGELGISQQRLLTVTEAIGNAVTISGGSAAGAQAALIQLGQGFASGALRGEELNSVMEQTPRLAKAIADGLGITIGQLREMGKEGKLTGEAVLGALEAQARTLSGEVQSSVVTVGQAMTVLQNSLTAASGEFDRVTGSTASMATFLRETATTVGDIAGAFRGLENAGAASFPIGAAIATVFETISVLGVNVAYVLRGIGTELGGLAAQAVAIATGEFSRAAEIRRQMVAESEKARRDVDALSDRILMARQLREQLSVAQRAIDDVGGDAGAYGEMISSKATAAAKATAAQLREVAQEAKAQQSVLNALNGVTDDYVESLRRLQAMRAAGKLTEEQYVGLVEKLIQKQPMAVEAEKRRIASVRDYIAVQEYREDVENKVAEAAAAADAARQQAIGELERRVNTLRDEADAAELVARANFTHAQAIERVTLRRLEDERVRLVNDPAELQALEKKIQLQRQIVSATDQAELRAANTKAAADAAADWQRTEETIRQGLTDAFRRAFESGEDFGTAFAKTIGNELKAQLAAALASSLANGVISLVTGASGGVAGAGGQTTGYLQAVQAASTLYGYGKAAYGYLGGGVSTTGSTLAASGSTLAAGGGAAANIGGASAGAILGDGSGLVAANATGSGSLGASSAWGGYIALAILAAMQGSSDYSAGFRREQSANSGTILGDASAKTADLFSRFGVSDRIADLISGATLTARIFGRAAPRVEDVGIQGSIAGGDFTGSAFADVVEKGGLFRSDKRYTETSVLSEELGRYLDAASRGVLDKAKDFGTALGLPVDALAQVSTDIKVTLTDDATKNQAAITEALSGYGDKLVSGFAEAIRPLAGYVDGVAETTAQTLQRVGQSILGVNDVLGQLGLTALKASVEGGRAATELEALFGGLGTLQQAAGSYLQNFYTDAERATLTTRGIGEALSQVGLAVPATRDAFRDLVEAQKLNTAEGREAFAVLMGVADAFAQIVPQARDAADILSERLRLEGELLTLQGNTIELRRRERESLDESNRTLYDQVKALEDQQSAAKAANDAAKEAAEAAADAADAAMKAARQMADAWEQLSANALSGVQSAYAAVTQAVDAERQQVQSTTEQAVRLAQTQADEGIRALEQQARTIESTFGGLARAMADQAQRLDGVLAGDAGRGAALQVLRNGVAGLASGTAVDPDALRQAAGTAAQIDTSGFGSALEYRRAVAETSILLRQVGSAASGRQTGELAAIAAQQIAIEKASAEEIGALEAARDAQLYALDQQLAEARASASTLVRIRDEVKGVAGAIGALATAVMAARALQGQQAAASAAERWLDAGSTEVWQSAAGAVGARATGDATLSGITIKDKLGDFYTAADAIAFIDAKVRANDELGLYKEAERRGISLSTIDQLKGWDGSAVKWAREQGLPIFHSGTDYVPRTGPALLEQGERIITAADNATIVRRLADGPDADLVAELRSLRAEVAALRAENISGHHATASGAGKAARLLDDVVNGGASLATRPE